MPNICLPAPVAAQAKFVSDQNWGACSIEHALWVKAKPDEFVGYEARLLYDVNAIAEMLDTAANLYQGAEDGSAQTAAILRAFKGLVVVAGGQKLPPVEASDVSPGEAFSSAEVVATLAITSAIHRIEKGSPETALEPLRQAQRVLADKHPAAISSASKA